MHALVATIDWDSVLQQPDVVPLMLGFGTAAIVILGVTIAVQWRKAQQTKYNAQLKERMIERGFTAEEIATVISATPEGRRHGQQTAIGACATGASDAANQVGTGAARGSKGCCTPDRG